jgi:hypothetical protein
MSYDHWLSTEPDYGVDEDRLATNNEAIAEFSRNVGAAFPHEAWLLHDNDFWVKNPHYSGPPVRHPEDDDPGEGEEPLVEGDPEPPEPAWYSDDKLVVARLVDEIKHTPPAEPEEIDDYIPF